MTAQVIQLTIRSARQDKLAHEIALQRLARQHRHAELRAQMLECIAEAEDQIARWQGIAEFGRATLAKFDGGPNDAA